jgi:hypothetical protein
MALKRIRRWLENPFPGWKGWNDDSALGDVGFRIPNEPGGV